MPKALIVFAHPEPRSFNGALCRSARDGLEEAGYDVEVSDLYAMGWKAELSPEDFVPGPDETGEAAAGFAPDGPADAGRVGTGANGGIAGTASAASPFDPAGAQEAAVAAGTQAADVAAEQEKLAAADLLVLQFPVWWFSMPAILKGWVDRVFARGFAYSAGRKYDLGHFTGKRAMLSITTGTARGTYEPAGVDGDLLSVLWPIHNGILAYGGFTVLPPFVVHAPAKLTDVERAEAVATCAARFRGVDESEPLFFHPAADYDREWRLKPGVWARSGVQWNPAAGQPGIPTHP